MRYWKLLAFIVIAVAIELAGAGVSAQVRTPPRVNEDPTRPSPPRPAPVQPAPPTSKPAPGPQPPVTTPAPPRVASPPLTDQQMMTIDLTIHQLGVERGKLAQTKTYSPEVRRFADQIVNDDSLNAKTSMSLMKNLKLPMQESDLTKTLKSDEASTLQLLNKLTRADFDKAYIDNEVTYCRNVLATLDTSLLPQVQSAVIKTAVQNSRTTLAGRLRQAEQLQSMFKGVK